MDILKLVDGTPQKYSVSKLRADNPQASFPATISDAGLAAYDCYRYTRPAPPEFDFLTEYTVDGAFTGGGAEPWVLGFNVVRFPEAEAAERVRSARDVKLSATDWRFRSDRVISPAWTTYCQALRDVPQQPGFPYDITWPTEPAS